MSIIEDLTALVQCGSHFDCETLQKLLLADQECAVNMSLCEALKSAVKQDADGNIFLDIPISLRLSEVHLRGDNPVVLEDTVWDDLRTPVTAIRLAGAQPPTETAYRGSSVLAFPSNADKTVYFILQLPHDWKEGSTAEIHIHWTISASGAGGGAENVKWDMTYSLASIFGSFPVESSSTETRDVQDDAQHDHLLTEIVEIDMSGETISNCILCSLTRDVAVANDYASDAYLVFIDMHYQKDSLGSKEELVK